jgi:hypothetical protein
MREVWASFGTICATRELPAEGISGIMGIGFRGKRGRGDFPEALPENGAEFRDEM